uniref:RNase H domain-containing protein n=1 Tax=Strongyloides venezuelensis TaxID=75913 RepID=A0A0K0FTH2_STRVS
MACIVELTEELNQIKHNTTYKCSYTVLNDSGYVAASVQNGWIYNDKESRAFQDLWSKATSLWKTSYKLVHVKAHTGISLNESADLVSKAYALEGLERSLYHLSTVLEDPSLTTLQSWLKEKIGC